jgi:hypothetical protein
LVYFLIHSVTIAFYLGAHLQQITAGAYVAVSKNNLSHEDIILLKETPSISNTQLIL